MHEMIDNIEEMERKLVEFAKDVMLGDKLDIESSGKVVDMIKDLADAKKNCFKACYYKSVVDAMDEQSGRGDRDGYNPRRYSTGRYAPAGKGHISGYMPPYMDDMHRMGYPDGRDGNQGGSSYQSGDRSGYTEPLMNNIRHMIADAPESERQHLKREVDKMFS